MKNELRLRNSSLTVVNSSLELSNGISCDGSVPMTLEISDSEISSSNRTSVVMDVNSERVTLSVANSRIIARNYNDGIAISAYSSVSLTVEKSSVLVSSYRTAVAVNSRTGNTNLTAIISRSLVEGSIAIETVYTVSKNKAQFCYCTNSSCAKARCVCLVVSISLLLTDL